MTAPSALLPASAPLLSVEWARRRLSDRQRATHIVLSDIRLDPGIAYALCGPTGIGKTTALEMLSLAAPPEGVETARMRVRDGGRDIDVSALMAARRRAAIAALRGRLFGYIAQTSRLLPFLTAAENIRVSQDIAGTRDGEEVGRLMERLQISSLAKSYPSKLSGGQRQRVCIARALAHRPPLVFADEPTSALDETTADTVLRLLVDYARAAAAAVLIITHDTTYVERFGLRLLRMEGSGTGATSRTLIRGADEDAGPRPSLPQALEEQP
ncbi:ATP-binding cassette domain-containing protein [Xanthobacter variabilis]|uniref:ATP-binding cassette domain-containing protein n=1 Tax=Xanthobacter variabilis TaxID=3119932 RepID=UPI003728CD77